MHTEAAIEIPVEPGNTTGVYAEVAFPFSRRRPHVDSGKRVRIELELEANVVYEAEHQRLSLGVYQARTFVGSVAKGTR
jgi:hypothetical protein